MKTRNGFVSNSSSSSFIVAIKAKNNTPCPCCGRKDDDSEDLLSCINKESDDYENKVRTNNTKETLEYIENNEKTWMDKEDYERMLESINKYADKTDWNIVNISISYHNSMIRTKLENMVNSGDAIIIESTEG